VLGPYKIIVDIENKMRYTRFTVNHKGNEMKKQTSIVTTVTTVFKLTEEDIISAIKAQLNLDAKSSVEFDVAMGGFLRGANVTVTKTTMKENETRT